MRVVARTFCLFLLPMLAGCPAPNPPPPRVVVAPMCSILAEARNNTETTWNGRVFVSDRTDPTAAAFNFAAFRSMAGPLGNPAIAFTNPTGVPDTYGVDEAWFRWLAPPSGFVQFPMVYRAQSTPALRPTAAGGPDNFGGGWNIQGQDSDGVWRDGPFTGSASAPNDPVTPEEGMLTVPHFMWVGQTNPHLYACAGGRSLGGNQTTWLIEISSPSAASPTVSVPMIQDVLSGTSNSVPVINAPGDPIRSGAVDCVMSQNGDDPTTRQLHLFSVSGGKLEYAQLSNFGATTSSGTVVNRFRTVVPWTDVGAAAGGAGSDNVMSAAAVALPNGVRFLFAARGSDDKLRLYDAGHFTNGTWLTEHDVFKESGDAPTGLVFAHSDVLNVAAASCPAFGATAATSWNDLSTDTVVALSGGNFGPAFVLLAKSSPQNWGIPGRPPSVYSPWHAIIGGSLTVTIGSATQGFYVRGLRIVMRPFADNVPPP